MWAEMKGSSTEMAREPSSSRSQKVPEEPYYLRGKVHPDVKSQSSYCSNCCGNQMYSWWKKPSQMQFDSKKHKKRGCIRTHLGELPYLWEVVCFCGDRVMKTASQPLSPPLPRGASCKQLRGKHIHSMIMKKGNHRLLFLIMICKAFGIGVLSEKY